MQQENDFIQKEIQRLNLFLTKLIEQALKLPATETERTIEEVESALKEEFDFTLQELSQMDALTLEQNMKEWEEQHLDKLVELIAIIVKNPKTKFDQKLAQKGIVILEYIEKHSKMFSMKRMELKNILQKEISDS